MFAVMSTEPGRRVIRRIIVRGGIYKSVFRQREGVRPEDTPVFNGAQRDFAQWVHDEAMEAHPLGFEKMNLEARLAKALEERADLVDEGTAEEDEGNDNA